MSDTRPVPAGAVPQVTTPGTSDLTVSDISVHPKWRVFSGEDVRTGTSARSDSRLVWSVSPGEWTVLGPKPEGEVVDLTHVRAMFRLTGEDGHRLLNKICSLDLGDGMFPNGAAGRTLVAGVATELVRDDHEGTRSYLIVPSRSFGRYLHDVIVDAGEEFGLELAPTESEPV